jgi:hypothetical protein
MSTNAMEALLGFDNQLKNPAPKETKGSTNYLKKEDLKKKYFSPQEDEVTFRMLPLRPDQPHHFSETAYFHEFRVNGQNKKLVCLNHLDGSPCPFCEKAAELKALSNDREKFPDDEKRKEIWKESRKYEAREFYILKGIDRGKTGDGVKFWRFKKAFNNKGTYDKLIPAIKKFYTKHQIEITDIEKGMDFEISTSEQNMSTGTGTYREVSAVMPSDPTPLSTKEKELEEWLNDTLTWKDIYKPTVIMSRSLDASHHMNAYEYLKAVLENRAPKWDDVNKKWLFRDAEGNLYTPEAPSNTTSSNNDEAPSYSDLQDATTFDSESDDLPF